MATSYAYNGYVRSFSNGVTTFDTVNVGVSVKGGKLDGPEVVAHMERNDAGAIIDLDGTGPATLVPPIWEQSYIFSGSYPDNNPQYKNLIKLKGEHGTLTIAIPRASDVQLLTATARLIEVTGAWDGANRMGTTSWFPITARWQLKSLLAT